MKKETKNKLLFVLSPVILLIITWIWLFYKNGRWYYYRDEWQFIPLLIMHLLFPVFYLVFLIVRIIRHINQYTRADSDLFYIVSSIILTVACFIGLLTFLVFTSGA